MATNRVQNCNEVEQLETFQPLKSCVVHRIDRLSSIFDLASLITKAKSTRKFSIHTTRATEQGTVTRIVIEFLDIGQVQNTVLLFEVLYLPPSTMALTFFAIHILLKTIFDLSKKFIVWSDDNRNDLQVFSDYEYIPLSILENINIIELQGPFKQWYNQTFKHLEHCYVAPVYRHDALFCVCAHRPYKNRHDHWSLSKAIEYVFNEYITDTNGNEMNYPENINHLIRCCLTITKLTMVVELNWTAEQISQYKRFH